MLVISICFFGMFLPILSEAINDFNQHLPKYLDKVEYVDGGFGDFTKYKEYYYSEDNILEFKNSKYFKKVYEHDIETLNGYFKHFEDYIYFFEYKEKYNFNKSQIKTDDYFYIESKDDYSYDNYDVYYVDMEKCIMYYIHSNI